MHPDGPGRLEDKSSLVRKAALQLLGELLASNPFGPQLPEADFAASLAHFRARLQVRLPPQHLPAPAACHDRNQARMFGISAVLVRAMSAPVGISAQSSFTCDSPEP